jgi:hypothetical protein
LGSEILCESSPFTECGRQNCIADSP